MKFFSTMKLIVISIMILHAYALQLTPRSYEMSKVAHKSHLLQPLIKSQQSKIMILKRISRLSAEGGSNDMEDDGRASASGSTAVESPKRRRPANVDLFAAEDRKMPSQADTMTVSPSISVPRKGADKESDKASEVKDSSAAKVTTPMGLQAEQLRLEAALEQLQIDQERIEKQKAVLAATDQLLMRLIIGKIGIIELVTSSKPEERALIRKDLFFRIVELANAESAESERQK